MMVIILIYASQEPIIVFIASLHILGGTFKLCDWLNLLIIIYQVIYFASVFFFKVRLDRLPITVFKNPFIVNMVYPCLVSADAIIWGNLDMAIKVSSYQNWCVIWHEFNRIINPRSSYKFKHYLTWNYVIWWLLFSIKVLYAAIIALVQLLLLMVVKN